MIGTVLLLGLILSLDNFRTALVLGAIRLSRRRALRVALVFGFWDGVAALVGILAGQYVGKRIGSTADYVAASALAAYGLYLVVQPGVPRNRRTLTSGGLCSDCQCR